MFTLCVLPVKASPRSGDPVNLTQVVKAGLARWRAGDYSGLWREAKEMEAELARPPCRRKGRGQGHAGAEDEVETQAQKNTKQAMRLAEEGKFSRATECFFDVHLTAYSIVTYAT